MRFNLKRLTLALLMSFVLCSSSAPTFASSYKHIPIDIIVNDNFISFDQAPFIDYDTTFVPIRFVSQALGAQSIEWDEEKKSATIIKQDTKIVLYENQTDAYVNDNKITLSKSARIEGDRLFVPVRFVSESFGAKVDWDEFYHNVYINLDSHTVDPAYISWSYTNDDVLWLARIVYAESRGEPIRGKIGVANVVLNRVKSPQFPNTIYNVIFDRKFGVQFEPIRNGSIYNTPSYDCMMSAKLALRGENTVGKSLYFLNPRIATSTWIGNTRSYYTTIGNHDFYL